MKSAVQAHVWKEIHAVNPKPVLLKQASNKQELTHQENIFITKNKDCIIHFEIPLADHLTRKFILNPERAADQLLQKKKSKLITVSHTLIMKTVVYSSK